MEPRLDDNAVAAAVRQLYGPVDLRTSTGVIHVVAAFEHDDDLRVLAIGPSAPQSETDFFVLNLTRARADAIIVTGKVLRDEPELRYDLQGASAVGLSQYRERILGKTQPPRLIVLTSGRGLDPTHPALHSWARPVIFTSEAATLPAAVTEHESIEVVRHPEPSLRGAIEWARSGGDHTIAIEAGPNTARSLYDGDRDLLDELLLSTFEGSTATEARGDILVGRTQLERQLVRPHHEMTVEEPSGPWRFERWVNRRAG
jgi:riboflavin biosynthesis pyrimidine reductase